MAKLCMFFGHEVCQWSLNSVSLEEPLSFAGAPCKLFVSHQRAMCAVEAKNLLLDNNMTSRFNSIPLIAYLNSRQVRSPPARLYIDFARFHDAQLGGAILS